MSLLEDVRAAVNKVGNFPSYEIAAEVQHLSANPQPVEVVQDTDTGAYSRWSTVNRAIIRRAGEYVAVVYHEPSTENQDWSDWSADEVEVYPVTPQQVITTVYVEA